MFGDGMNDVVHIRRNILLCTNNTARGHEHSPPNKYREADFDLLVTLGQRKDRLTTVWSNLGFKFFDLNFKNHFFCFAIHFRVLLG